MSSYCRYVDFMQGLDFLWWKLWFCSDIECTFSGLWSISASWLSRKNEAWGRWILSFCQNDDVVLFLVPQATEDCLVLREHEGVLDIPALDWWKMQSDRWVTYKMFTRNDDKYGENVWFFPALVQRLAGHTNEAICLTTFTNRCISMTTLFARSLQILF